jgi:FkbM family methyltransferase
MQSYSLTDNTGKELDKKLDDLFQQKDNGFFIELGANDGLTQSNTAMLEFMRGWKGILIEPSPSAYELCKVNRPGSITLNYACVSNEYTDKSVKGDFNGKLMSSVDGLRLQSEKTIDVAAITLESILDKYAAYKNINFLSLDTEGYELNILKGLNLDKYRPQYMLIEIYSKDYKEIYDYLESKQYTLHSNFTNYNKETNPLWDGTHNDYLFYDKLCGV